jgi:hypothetical protein
MVGEEHAAVRGTHLRVGRPAVRAMSAGRSRLLQVSADGLSLFVTAA